MALEPGADLGLVGQATQAEAVAALVAAQPAKALAVPLVVVASLALASLPSEDLVAVVAIQGS